ncbi:hypothetical protein L1987_16277 [Smallanthus sonchifolius]|uniref:Uncharacterized protein n=1 Tax=Smallanthus sonchifolius TaxID=185202 RepID=A0ACB9JAJ8_9ASTR|nr:hypothetical protein L1987_16277 [Smallanthus sonchifolius]
MRYLDLIECYHQNAREMRDMESYGNSLKDEDIGEGTGVNTVDGSPKRRRVKAISDFPPMSVPNFGYENFKFLGSKSSAESKPKEDFEDCSSTSKMEQVSEDFMAVNKDSKIQRKQAKKTFGMMK